ncbi:MAG: hypothetical protein ACREBT_06840 [Thermoplasmata archaeon]
MRSATPARVTTIWPGSRAELVAAMERSGWVLRGAHDFVLTRVGELQLARRGVDLRACRDARRKLAPGCLDWTERRLHIGGALGAAILARLLELGYLQRTTGRRLRIVRPVARWVRDAAGRGPTPEFAPAP